MQSQFTYDHNGSMPLICNALAATYNCQAEPIVRLAVQQRSQPGVWTGVRMAVHWLKPSNYPS